MKRLCITIVAAASLIYSESLWADILEIRGRGYVNGRLLSDDGKKVTFKNHSGQVEVLSKSDVLFYEKEAPRKAVAGSSPKRSGARPSFSIESAKEFFKEIYEKISESVKEKVPDLKKRWADLTKPVGRSQAVQGNKS